jgi:hypothetical protein
MLLPLRSIFLSLVDRLPVSSGTGFFIPVLLGEL